jgi:CTP synthase
MVNEKNRTKYIFVTGGVISSLGKGIVAASIGALLENRGLKVVLTKADPYINLDPGTMSPYQHGEVYVTEDGAETDLDIGHYERFTRAQLSKSNSFSTGQIYDRVLHKERKGDYLGGTVQVIPHITDEIKAHIFRASADADISIVEIGGTVGDIEGLPFLESIRQIRYDLGDENVLFVHLTLVPYIKAARELKTKPTQHSVKELRQVGIQPHIIVCRSERPISTELRAKLANTCDVRRDCVIECMDADSIYQVPMILHEQKLDQIIVDKLNIWTRAPSLTQWQKIVYALENPKREVNIAVVGKYVDVVDSYKSINEALIHAGIHHQAKVNVAYIDAAEINQNNVKAVLETYDGVIIPGGFGERGIEGKVMAIQYLRESKIPFLGICLGMQLAVIEFARNVIGEKNVGSTEFTPDCDHPVIHIMEDQKGVMQKGGTMRLGAYPCKVQPGTNAFKIYGRDTISERHRHRYEFNNDYRDLFSRHGMIFSGVSPDNKLVEMIEIKDHPWYVAVQFHPELKSKPMEVHPLFRSFVEASLTHE